jgi:hypothetical protein
MKCLLVYADGRTWEHPHPWPAAQWLQSGGRYFYGAEAFDREEPYRGSMVYLEIPKSVYDSPDRHRMYPIPAKPPAAIHRGTS